MSAHPRPRRRVLSAPPPLLALLALVGLLVGPVAPAATASAGPPARIAAASSTASSTALLTVIPATGAPSAPIPSPRATDDDARPSQDRRGAQDEAEPEVTVLITSVSPQVVRPDDELTVRATLRNDTEDTIESPVASLHINRFLRSTRSSLQQWLDHPLRGTAGTPVETLPLPGPLEPGDSVDVELRVPAVELGLSRADAAWGPRGISVLVTDAGRREGVARTFVLWRPTEQEVTPARVTVLVPLTGGPVDPTAVAPREPTSSADGDASTRDDEETADDAGTRDADTTQGEGDADTSGPDAADAGADEGPGETPPTDGPTAGPADDAPEAGDPAAEPGTEPTTGTTATDDPATDDPAGTTAAPLGAPTDDDLDRLEAVLGATADQAAVSWALDPALLAAARSVAATERAQRWAEDLTDAGSGRDVVALPARDSDLAALAHGGGDVLAAEAYARARATSDPIFGPTPRADLAWPAGEVPDLATVALAARSGATAVVVGGDALATEPLTYTPTGRGTVTTPDGDLAALVADPVLTELLDEPSAPTAATAAQRMLAESAVIARERPSEQRHLLVAASRGWEPDPEVAAAQLDALASAPWVDLTGLPDLVAAPDPGLARTPLPAMQVADDEIPPGEIAALLTARAELAAFTGIVPDPARLLAGADDAVLAPTSVAWRADPVQRSLVVSAVVADLAARRSGVTVVPGSSLNLISETGRFPLGLRNDLEQDVTVQVAVDPGSPVLVIDEAQTVTIEANSETQVRIPFHAVGSGDVPVTVTLRALDGTALGPPQQFTVRVRADWENVGTAVVAGLLGLALVVGIIRTIRRGQTRHRGAGDTPVDEIARLPEDAS